MVTTVLKTPPTFGKPAAYICSTGAGGSSVKPHNFHRISFTSNWLLPFPVIRCRSHHSRATVNIPSRRVRKVLNFAADGDTQTETQEKDPALETDSEPEIEENTDGAANVDGFSESNDAVVEELSSVVIASLNAYKQALENNDDSKVAEIESFLKSIEDEKIDLENKVATLSEELSYEKDRVLRISADFKNFRTRTEREQLSLKTNERGEVLENLLPVLDNFERAKAQIKVETEGEEKISNSYQSIYKQFVEILGTLGVVPVETVGKPFDPMVSSRVGSEISRVIGELFQKLYKVYSGLMKTWLHEAILREESIEYEEGVIIEQYRKGFQLGDRLLRPSMVKVSAGPGPAKAETAGKSEEEEAGGESEASAEGSSETTETEV